MNRLIPGIIVSILIVGFLSACSRAEQEKAQFIFGVEQEARVPAEPLVGPELQNQLQTLQVIPKHPGKKEGRPEPINISNSVHVYEKERVHYRHVGEALTDPEPLEKDQVWIKGPRPQLCVALSGGGIRAGTFAMGVLKSLHDRKILENVDVISAVSGGGYGLAWLNAQMARRNFSSVSDVFKNDPRANGELKQDVTIYDLASAFPSVLGSFLISPINIFLNGFFGAHINTSLVPDFYEEQLHKAFLSDEVGKVESVPIRMSDLSNSDIAENERPNLPFPVFSMTASARFFEDDDTHRLWDVFEITPISMGSDRYRYLFIDGDNEHADELLNLPIEDVMASSGAAVDTAFFFKNPIVGQVASAFNIDLGRYIDNYEKENALSIRFPRPENKVASADIKDAKESTDQIERSLNWRWVPVPGHFTYEKLLTKDEDTDRHARIYLTDGGHSDNLGLIVLMKRMCRQIIVVDAEYSLDGTRDAFTYRFEAVCRIEKMLGVQKTSDWRLDIDKLPSGLKCQHHKIEEQQTKGVRDALICDDKGATATDCVGDNPVRQITYSLAKDGAQSVKLGTITIIKLSIDRSLVSADCKYGDVVCEFYNQEWSAEDRDKLALGIPIISDDKFPQNNTINQSFTAKQFNAYVELGRHIADEHLLICGEIPDTSNEKNRTALNFKLAAKTSGC